MACFSEGTEFGIDQNGKIKSMCESIVHEMLFVEKEFLFIIMACFVTQQEALVVCSYGLAKG